MQVSVKNINVIYLDKQKKEIHALDNFSATFLENKLTVILGPSGSGKSTLLNVIAGLTSYQGDVYFDKDNVNKLASNKRSIGYVFQSYALFPYLSVKNNILFPISKLSSKEKEEKLNSVTNLLSLTDLLNRKPSECSGGEAQRVAVARAIIKSPSILLLDEPFSALDAKLRKETRTYIKSLQKKLAITTVMVTHDQDEAFSLADNLIIINEGKNVFEGTKEELLKIQDDDFLNSFISK